MDNPSSPSSALNFVPRALVVGVWVLSVIGNMSGRSSQNLLVSEVRFSSESERFFFLSEAAEGWPCTMLVGLRVNLSAPPGSLALLNVYLTYSTESVYRSLCAVGIRLPWSTER